MGLVTKFARSIAALIALELVAAQAYAVGTRRIAIRSADDFAAGELQGIAVDSTGMLRPGYDLAEVPVKDVTTIWSALDLGGGKLLLGTGNDGKLLEFSNGATRVVADADALVLSSVVRGFGGRIFVAALPGGKILEYAQGKLKDWATLPKDTNIYQLAFDPAGQALYAATGPDGKLYRIGADAKAQVHFDASEQHLASVAVGKNGVLIGTGDKGKLYEVSAPGRAKVVFDFGMTEVRAITPAANGDVYAIANEIKSGRNLPSANTEAAKKSSSASGKGVLYRFEGGSPERLFESNDEHLSSLSLDAKGLPIVGTGEKGRVYSVDKLHNSVLLADVDERQVSVVSFGSAGTLVLASDPAVVHPLRVGDATDRVWTSAVVDAGFRANFGRFSWEGEGAVEFETRTGNTKEADEGWSEWSKPLLTPGKVTSEPARYFQVRARFRKDLNAYVREVNVAFVTDNLQPLITEINVESKTTESFEKPSDKLGSSGGPISGKTSDEVELSWKVENPDKDELRYRLWYSPLAIGQWYPLLEPGQVWTKSSYTWDTADLPEGKYRVRIEVSDELANAPTRAKRHQLDSYVILVDNTAPVIQGLTVNGRRATFKVTDGVGPIARVEVAVAGTDEWLPFEPLDGVFDDNVEAFDLDLSAVAPAGPALLTVRAYDQENNQVVGNVWLK
jgi:hypothetical protein